jgi:hypothetical protein
MRQFGSYSDLGLKKDIEQLVLEFNRQTEPIEFDVAVAGTEVEITHGLGKVPVVVVPAVTSVCDGQGIIYPGTSAWTAQSAFLTATIAGKYAVIARR